jgi:hypothetical protein
MLYRVLRQDETGNIFLVKGGLLKEVADQLCQILEQKGHKQTYWVEAEKEIQSSPT